MGRFDTAPVTVPIGPCECPGSPHDQDEVYLRPRLGYEAGTEAAGAMQLAAAADGQVDTNRLARLIVPVYIRAGAVGWNLLDADGEPVPFDAETILTDWDTALIVGEQADDLYSERIFGPLAAMASSSSQAGRTSGSTSATRRSSRSSRKPSSRSSTTTTRTADIVTISPPHGTASRSSRKPALAG